MFSIHPGPPRRPQEAFSLAWIALAMAGSLSLLTLGCGGTDDSSDGRAKQAEEAEKVVIGVVWPWEARSELLFPEGIDMATEEINAAGGVTDRPLEIRREDDHESVNDGRLVAQGLANDPEVMAVIGHLQSHVTVPAAGIYDMAGLVLFSPAATSPDLTSKGYQYVFRGTFDDIATGTQLAELALDRGWERIGVYYVRSIYGRTLANAFEERLSKDLKAQIMVRDSYDPVQQVRPEMLEQVLLQWRQLDLDAIFLASEVPAAGGIIKAIREAEIDVPILGGDAMSSPALIQVGGEAVEGTMVACFFHLEDPRPQVQDFVAAFQEKYGKVPDVGAALAYDAVKVLAHAMNLAGTPAPDQVAETLRKMPAYEGITGTFEFDETGKLVDRKISIISVDGGEFHWIGESEDEGSE